MAETGSSPTEPPPASLLPVIMYPLIPYLVRPWQVVSGRKHLCRHRLVDPPRRIPRRLILKRQLWTHGVKPVKQEPWALFLENVLRCPNTHQQRTGLERCIASHGPPRKTGRPHDRKGHTRMTANLRLQLARPYVPVTDSRPGHRVGTPSNATNPKVSAVWPRGPI